jgi:hypothetical protein
VAARVGYKGWQNGERQCKHALSTLHVILRDSENCESYGKQGAISLSTVGATYQSTDDHSASSFTGTQPLAPPQGSPRLKIKAGRLGGAELRRLLQLLVLDRAQVVVDLLQQQLPLGALPGRDAKRRWSAPAFPRPPVPKQHM